MPVAISLQVLLDLFCVIHIYRSGKPQWWYFVVMAFPVIGALAYLLLEVLPGREGRRLARKVIKTVDPEADLRERQRQLEICDSHDRKVALAAEMLQRGQYDEALGLYQSCLVAPNENDPQVFYGLAQAYFWKGDATNCLQWLQCLLAEEPWYKGGDAKLMQARALIGAGNFKEADMAFQEVVGRHVGEESWARYSKFLVEQGQLHKAEQILLEMEKRCRINPGYYGQDNRQWVNAVKDELAQAKAS